MEPGANDNVSFCGKLPSPVRFKCWVWFDAADREQADKRVADWRRSTAASKIFEMDEKEFKDLWPGIILLLGV